MRGAQELPVHTESAGHHLHQDWQTLWATSCKVYNVSASALAMVAISTTCLIMSLRHDESVACTHAGLRVNIETSGGVLCRGDPKVWSSRPYPDGSGRSRRCPEHLYFTRLLDVVCTQAACERR